MRMTLIITLSLGLWTLGGCGTDTAECLNDYDCEGAKVCRPADQTCEFVRCENSADCGSGEICVDKDCVPDVTDG